MGFNGYRESVLTFQCTTNTKVGDLVKMKESGLVEPTSLADHFIGIVVAISGEYAAIQLDGYVEMQTPEPIKVGYRKLASWGNNAVIEDENIGIDRLVIYSKEETVGFIL